MRWKEACYGGNGCDGKVLRCGAGERHQQWHVLVSGFIRRAGRRARKANKYPKTREGLLALTKQDLLHYGLGGGDVVSVELVHLLLFYLRIHDFIAQVNLSFLNV
jgi:hypothetical protein